MRTADRKLNRRKVLQWFKQGVFTIDLTTGTVRKGNRVLKTRLNKRNRSDRCDLRVDLCHQNCIYSINISHIAWMVYRGTTIPKDFEIHHVDEDPMNNTPENLVCIYKHDHCKLHPSETEEVPF